MGQPDAFLLVAKVNGRYRQICAVAHNWALGSGPLRRCSDFLRIFQDPTNRMAIQQELIAAEDHEKSLWPGSDNDSDNDSDDYKESVVEYDRVPFPFIATCLLRGAAPNNAGYYNNFNVARFNHSSTWHGYNDGE